MKKKLLASRFDKVKVSTTMKFNARAKELALQGIDIIDFTVGEPDFPTPDHIKEAAKKAIDINYTKYTVNPGSIEIRKAIQSKLKKDNNLDYELNEIIVSNGAKQAIYNAVTTLIDEGDEVVIPAPYYVSYPEMVNLSKGIPVVIQTKEENGFKLTPQELSNAITGKTKAFIICYPNNPTGTTYSKEELNALAGILEKHEIFVLSDEIYEKIIYDDYKFLSFASLSNKMKERTVIINGASKAYSMTGWRIGYAAGPKEIIDGCNIVQSHSTSGASSISQYAATAALLGTYEETSRMVKEFQRRRDYMLKRLGEIPNIIFSKPNGAFYIFPNVSAYFGKIWNGSIIKNSTDLSHYILEEAKVGVVPGIGFGTENYIRLSYSTKMENIEKGMDRIIEAFKRL
jgi:aspartate/methionine/tyrosine aminotransferase